MKESHSCENLSPEQCITNRQSLPQKQSVLVNRSFINRLKMSTGSVSAEYRRLADLPIEIITLVRSYWSMSDRYRISMSLLSGRVSVPYPAIAALHYARIVNALRKVCRVSNLAKTLEQLWYHPKLRERLALSRLAGI